MLVKVHVGPSDELKSTKFDRFNSRVMEGSNFKFIYQVLLLSKD